MEDNLRLLSAAIAARDGLRLVVLPGLDQLARRATQPETAALVEKLRYAAHMHADGLRLAIKDRKARVQKDADLPCWSKQP